MPQRIPDCYLSEHPVLLLSVDEAKERIETRIDKAPLIAPDGIKSKSEYLKVEQEVNRWSVYNEDLLKRCFSTTRPAEEYSWFSSKGFSRVNPSPQQQALDLKHEVEEKVSRLRSILERLELIPVGLPQPVQEPAEGTSPSPSRVFIVHGHDDAARESVARFLEKLGVEAVILHEQASSGSTVIEKLEKFSDVSFAAVLLTPDDVGAASSPGSSPRPRARQNVILELGYFIGKLGRKNVCALHKGDVELPSDILGVVYVRLDESEAWKLSLARELVASGFNVDMNKVL
jgi:predicted nucleotide-binding protein